MSGEFSPRYSDAQRAAIVAAYDGMTAPAVADRARRGELEHGGQVLEPFEVPASTVRSLARDARRRRSGEMRSELANAAPGDALEDLRRRLVSAIDHELRQIERRQKAGKVVKGEELRQLARAYRELAARSGPIDSRPPAPGARRNGVRDGGATRGGIAGELLADHRATGSRPDWPPAATPAPHESTMVDWPSSDAVGHESDVDLVADDDSPAALVARFVAGEEIHRVERNEPERGPALDVARGDHETGGGRRDGFDYSRLPAEDVSDIERSERGRL